MIRGKGSSVIALDLHDLTEHTQKFTGRSGDKSKVENIDLQN